MSNHLGNVLTVINACPPSKVRNIKVPYLDGSDLAYYATIVSTADYSPFGVQLDGRTESAESYRYGFNGMEKDDEMKGAGNSYDFGARIHDPRLGRFLSLDPLKAKYPSYSPYHYASDNPIWKIDRNGEEGVIFQEDPPFQGGIMITIKWGISYKMKLKEFGVHGMTNFSENKYTWGYANNMTASTGVSVVYSNENFTVHAHGSVSAKAMQNGNHEASVYASGNAYLDVGNASGGVSASATVKPGVNSIAKDPGLSTAEQKEAAKGLTAAGIGWPSKKSNQVFPYTLPSNKAMFYIPEFYVTDNESGLTFLAVFDMVPPGVNMNDPIARALYIQSIEKRIAEQLATFKMIREGLIFHANNPAECAAPGQQSGGIGDLLPDANGEAIDDESIEGSSQSYTWETE